MMAIGGGIVALAPDMQRFVVDSHHWMSNEEFLKNFTIGQVAPGPSMLFVTLIGMQAAGWLGAIAATIGIVLPPAVFTLTALRFGAKMNSGRFACLIKTALAPLSVGMMTATGWSLSHVAMRSTGTITLGAITVILLLCTRLNPLWIIAMGGICGAIGWI